VSSRIEDRLKSLGLKLPEPMPAAGTYVPGIVSGHHVFISGQVCFDENGEVATKGRLGAEVGIEEGYAAARLCTLQLLAQLKRTLDGDLERVGRCLKLGGFVASTPDFTQHPKVMNGASDLMVEVMGEDGRHARFAVGMAALPLGAAVEVEATFELR